MEINGSTDFDLNTLTDDEDEDDDEEDEEDRGFEASEKEEESFMAIIQEGRSCSMGVMRCWTFFASITLIIFLLFFSFDPLNTTTPEGIALFTSPPFVPLLVPFSCLRKGKTERSRGRESLKTFSC